MGRLFGTDGVRGVANRDLTAELALQLGAAAARILTAAEVGTAGASAQRRPTAVVGRDPRASGEFLEAAVVAGIASAGVDVIRVGVLPTPAVAYLTDLLAADFGAMLSASHNPMPDNGIKFFAAGGRKLADEAEDRIEAMIGLAADRPTGAGVGRVRDRFDLADAYVEHIVAVCGADLAGLRVVVDCAHGAASAVGPAAYRAAGAQVIELACEPDGLNINEDCGSTHLGGLRDAVLAHRADAGLAHDGDADRCLAIAADGSEVDGDQILAIFASGLREAGTLADDTVVTTVMANLGFRLSMAEQGIKVIETAVGDRYVLEAMRAGGYTLGGEQSGHIVLSDYATTGDGVLSGLVLLGRMAATGRALTDLAASMRKLPQVLVNVTGVDRGALADSAQVRQAVAAAEQQLGSSGRVLLRPSGTEPVVRVMVEAPTPDQAQQVADAIASAVRDAIALPA